MYRTSVLAFTVAGVQAANHAVPTATATFAPIPLYTGPLSTTGTFRVVEGPGGLSPPVLEMDWTILGADPVCVTRPAGVTNACGIHIHAGTSCGSIGAPYWSAVAPVTTDPWTDMAYTSTAAGGATATAVPITTGYGIGDLNGRTVVLHDSAGTAIGCGEIATANVVVAPTTNSPVTGTGATTVATTSTGTNNIVGPTTNNVNVGVSEDGEGRNEEEEDGDGLTDGQIAAAVVGAVLGAVLLALLVWVLCKNEPARPRTVEMPPHQFYQPRQPLPTLAAKMPVQASSYLKRENGQFTWVQHKQEEGEMSETQYDYTNEYTATGSAPRSPRRPIEGGFVVGEAVRALYLDGIMYDATVRAKAADGTYHLQWSDGSLSDNVSAVNMVAVPPIPAGEVADVVASAHTSAMRTGSPGNVRNAPSGTSPRRFSPSHGAQS